MSVKRDIAKELHKQARRNFPTRSVELKGIDDLYQADLVEMQLYAKVNSGFKYILTLINCSSKFAFAFPLKSKKGDDVVKVLEPILKKYKTKNFQTDDGGEWFNSKMKALLSMFNIHHYSTYSDKKASIVKRFNRTLKSNMWRKITEQGNYRWVSILNELIDKYNNRVHRTIGFKLKDVSYKNEHELLLNILTANQKNRKRGTLNKFNIGDRVRISKYKRTFAKGYMPNWTKEVFTIWKVKMTQPINYVLKDEKWEIVKGSFYAEELSKTRYGNVYLLEKVLKKRGNKLLVRWLGFDKKEDSWIEKKEA